VSSKTVSSVRLGQPVVSCEEDDAAFVEWVVAHFASGAEKEERRVRQEARVVEGNHASATVAVEEGS
jgi:hypothetical protein